jgi:hypothetical protein
MKIAISSMTAPPARIARFLFEVSGLVFYAILPKYPSLQSPNFKTQ